MPEKELTFACLSNRPSGDVSSLTAGTVPLLLPPPLPPPPPPLLPLPAREGDLPPLTDRSNSSIEDVFADAVFMVVGEEF